MTVDDLKARLQAELPELLKQDSSFRQWLEQLIRETAVTQENFDARFDRMLREFAEDRAEQRRKWDEHDREWREWVAKYDAKVEEDRLKWDEQNRKWYEHDREWREWVAKYDVKAEEDRIKWDEQNRKWDEQNRKWDEQNRKNNQLLEEIKLSRTRQEQGIGALGARWGIASEHSFRAALKGILEQSFGVQVLNVNEFDDAGVVFGAPDQVEIDIIVRNGELILCELKSSMSKSDMYTFDRKVRFYEQRHQRQAQRRIVISPMVPQPARAVAEKLGIEVFGYAEDATGL
jgi:hypothetical protein